MSGNTHIRSRLGCGRLGDFSMSGRTIQPAGRRAGVGIGELPQTACIGQIGGNVLPGAQFGGCLDDVRGAGAVGKMQGHAGIRILDDAVNERRRRESEPIHVQVTRAGLWVVTENRKLLAWNVPVAQS